MVPKLLDLSTWTGRTGHDGPPSFSNEDGICWLEQNATKTSKCSKWAKQGHDVAWEFGLDGRYTGRMLIDGEILTASEPTKRLRRRILSPRSSDGSYEKRARIGIFFHDVHFPTMRRV